MPETRAFSKSIVASGFSSTLVEPDGFVSHRKVEEEMVVFPEVSTMRRPFLALGVPYAAGLLLSSLVEDAWLPGLLMAGIGCGFLALFAPATRRVALPALLVLVGWAHLNLRCAVLSPHDLRRIAGPEPDWVTVRGTLCATPQLRRTDESAREPWRTLAEVDVLQLRRRGEWLPAVGRVRVSTPGRLGAGYFGGRQVEVTGVLRLPDVSRAEGLFDYRRHLCWRGMYYELRSQGADDWRLTGPADGARPPLGDRFQRWAQAALARGLPVEDEPLRLQWAMVLGWRTALTEEVAEPFMRSGTMHIFAISGLHVALIAKILVRSLCLLRLPRGGCGLVVLPALWFYTAATGWQASAIRSTIMMSVVLLGWTLRRPGDLLNSLFSAAFLILVWDPRQLFQAGFQLSFFVVLSLVLCQPPIERWQRERLQPDPWLPEALRPEWRRRLDRPLSWLVSASAASLAAWLGSLPLVAYYFHLVTPVSLLANLVIVPLSGLALVCGLGSLACATWLPAVSELFNHAGWLWMSAMAALSRMAASWPGACFHTVAPPFWLMAVYYLVLTLALSGWLFQRRHWVPLAGLFAGVLLASLIHQKRSAPVQITVLPLRGGDSLLVEAPGRRRDLLVDTGDEAGAQWTVIPFLRARGVNRLPAMALTHGDVRHVGGAPALAARFRTDAWFVSPLRFRSTVYRRVCGELPAARRGVVERGDHLQGWQVLHPAADDRYAAADDGALVLRSEVHGFRILLVSDLGRLGWRTLLEREADLAADVLVAGLPGRTDVLSEEVLAAVRPRAVILSASESAAPDRVPRALWLRLQRRHLPVFCTGDDGAVCIRLRPGWLAIHSRAGREEWLPPIRP